MQKFKKLIVTVAVLSILVAGGVGILLVLDLVNAEQTKDALITVFQVFGIVTVVCALLILILQLNKKGGQNNANGAL